MYSNKDNKKKLQDRTPTAFKRELDDHRNRCIKLTKIIDMADVKTIEITKVSQHGLNFIANEEGCVLHPYKDSVGVWTIAVGCTYWENGQKIKPTDPPITRERALQLFSNVIKHYEMTVWSVTRDDINQNQFDALVSLCYNIGEPGFKGSTLLRKINANPKDKEGITAAFLMWRNAGGKPILLARRKREANLFFS